MPRFATRSTTLAKNSRNQQKSLFDLIRGADALPVLGREIVKGEQFFPILDQAGSGFGVFRFIGLNEQIEGSLGVFPGLSLPDVV